MGTALLVGCGGGDDASTTTIGTSVATSSTSAARQWQHPFVDRPEWTVARHLDGKPPEVVGLYERFVDLVAACGPYTLAISRTGISFKGTRRGFAGAKPKQQSLDGYLDLQRAVQDPRFRRASPYTKRLFVHQFRITTPEQLDDAFAAWVREAYAVGAGAHLDRDIR